MNIQLQAPDKPAPGNARIASRLTIKNHWPRLLQPQRYEATMNVQAFLALMLLLTASHFACAFEPEPDPSIGITPTNMARFGVSFRYYAPVPALVEIKLPDQHGGIPFRDAYLHLFREYGAQNLKVPVHAYREDGKIVLSFWSDAKTLHDLRLTATFRQPFGVNGVQFRFVFSNFVDSIGNSRDTVGPADSSQLFRSETNRAPFAAGSGR